MYSHYLQKLQEFQLMVMNKSVGFLLNYALFVLNCLYHRKLAIEFWDKYAIIYFDLELGKYW